jgi:F-type H+-transporting ATPase subunit b
MEALAKIGVDWMSLVFYSLNIGVIIYLLSKYVYTPLLNYLDERRKFVADNLAQAEQTRIKFEAEVRDLESRMAAEQKAQQENLVMQKRHAEEQAKALVAQGEAERNRLIEQARTEAIQMKTNLEQNVESDMIARTGRIVEEAVRQNLSGEEAKLVIQKMWKLEQKNLK